jgi:hypothetical protein
LRIQGRENGDLGAVAPYSRVPLILQMSETSILIRLLRMYFPRNWEFGSLLSKLQYFGEFKPHKSPRYATAVGYSNNISKDKSYKKANWRKLSRELSYK